MVAVLDAEPSLGSGIALAGLPEARREALAPLLHAPEGPWEWEHAAVRHSSAFGALILDGIVAHHQRLGELHHVELLGAGDLIRPCSYDHDTLVVESSWVVLSHAQLAILDRDFALRTRRWPEIAASLIDRATIRARSLGIKLAIHSAVRVQDRVHLMLWHLADRWGHVTPQGVTLPIALTHESLAQLVGARRSPVTLALGNLKREGLVTRDAHGSWVLSGDPPLRREPARATP